GLNFAHVVTWGAFRPVFCAPVDG
ncbi:MAG: hypothetical protein QOK18_431, partial [Mycobacterium sp.]|nr:hypothetical protein [Mycobacterium sp.]